MYLEWIENLSIFDRELKSSVHRFTCPGSRSFAVNRVRHDKTTTKDNDYDKTCHATRQDNDNIFSKN